MEGKGNSKMNGVDVKLPPGFKFDPTDEELLIYFLYRKVAKLPPCNSAVVIPTLRHSSHDPSDLTTAHEAAALSQKNWYFFSRVEEEKRETKNGHWEDINVNKPIFSTSFGNIIGMKKHFVFFNKKQIPNFVHTNWIMEQYHLSNTLFKQPELEEWVLCRVQESSKDNCDSKGIIYSCDHQSNCGDDDDDDDDDVELSLMDEMFLAMDDDEDEEINYPH